MTPENTPYLAFAMAYTFVVGYGVLWVIKELWNRFKNRGD